MQLPNYGKKLFPIVRRIYGKTQTFQIYGFPKYFIYKFKNMRKVNSYSQGRNWKKENILKVLVSHIFRMKE